MLICLLLTSHRSRFFPSCAAGPSPHRRYPGRRYIGTFLRPLGMTACTRAIFSPDGPLRLTGTCNTYAGHASYESCRTEFRDTRGRTSRASWSHVRATWIRHESGSTRRGETLRADVAGALGAQSWRLRTWRDHASRALSAPFPSFPAAATSPSSRRTGEALSHYPAHRSRIYRYRVLLPGIARDILHFFPSPSLFLPRSPLLFRSVSSFVSSGQGGRYSTLPPFSLQLVRRDRRQLDSK